MDGENASMQTDASMKVAFIWPNNLLVIRVTMPKKGTMLMRPQMERGKWLGLIGPSIKVHVRTCILRRCKRSWSFEQVNISMDAGKAMVKTNSLLLRCTHFSLSRRYYALAWRGRLWWILAKRYAARFGEQLRAHEPLLITSPRERNATLCRWENI